MTRRRKGFTMVELMVVVLIVGILAAVAVPLMSGRIDSSKWSEGKAAMGTIASALRVYAAEKGGFATAPLLTDIGFKPGDLNGTYFSDGDYAITSASAAGGQVDFVITCTANPGGRTPGAPTSPPSMTLTSAARRGHSVRGAAARERVVRHPGRRALRPDRPEVLRNQLTGAPSPTCETPPG